MEINQEKLMDKKTHRLNLTVSPEIGRLLSELAKAEKLSQNELVARLILREAQKK